MEPSWFAIACGDVPETTEEETPCTGSKIHRIIFLDEAEEQYFIELCKDLDFDWETIAYCFHVTVPNAIFLWNKYSVDWI